MIAIMIIIVTTIIIVITIISFHENKNVHGGKNDQFMFNRSWLYWSLVLV